MNIRLQTLTPVHVGSGRQLQYGAEYVVSPAESKGQMVHIIDDRKVLDLIGADNVDGWVESINQQKDTSSFIASCVPSCSPSDYSARSMEVLCDVKKGDPLKEFIHDGMGVPYLPGSSIKGAIRTAILAAETYDFPDLETKIVDEKKNKPNKPALTSKFVESALFGKDPNHSIFRLIRIGDAFFSKGSEEVRRLMMYFNITHSCQLIPTSDTKPMLTEVIKAGQEATLRIQVDIERYDKFQELAEVKQTQLPLAPLPSDLDSIYGLFYYINSNTKYLLEKEIKFWEEQNSRGREGASRYIEQLSDLLTLVTDCRNQNDEECILRIGHASGWDFITGAWTKGLDNYEEMVIPASRPNNNSKYKEYPFPKSRRLDSDGDVLGFVRLSILPE